MYIPLILSSKVHTFSSTQTQGFAPEPKIKEIEKVEFKPTYEPITVQVNEIAPMVVLCASPSGKSGAPGLQSYKGF